MLQHLDQMSSSEIPNGGYILKNESKSHEVFGLNNQLQTLRKQARELQKKCLYVYNLYIPDIPPPPPPLPPAAPNKIQSSIISRTVAHNSGILYPYDLHIHQQQTDTTSGTVAMPTNKPINRPWNHTYRRNYHVDDAMNTAGSEYMYIPMSNVLSKIGLVAKDIVGGKYEVGV